MPEDGAEISPANYQDFAPDTSAWWKARQEDVARLEDPIVAEAFVRSHLTRPEGGYPVSDARITELLGATPERTALIAKLTYELSGSMTSEGVSHWFDRERYQLDGRSPMELIEDNPKTAAEVLLDLARGGQTQIAT